MGKQKHQRVKYKYLDDERENYYLNKGNMRRFRRARLEFVEERRELENNGWKCIKQEKDKSGMIHYTFTK